MAKACSVCGAVKDEDEFPKGRRQCWPCRRQYVKQYNATYHAQNRERILEQQRASHRRNIERRKAYQADYRRRVRPWLREFGITAQEYDAMLEAQGGGCAICGRTEADSGARLHVDHDHSCCPGKGSCGSCVRGLLCLGCNTALGGFRDDPVRIQRAADYLNGVRVNG